MIYKSLFRFLYSQNFYFPLITWLISRCIILVALLAIAPLLSAPPEPAIKAELGLGVFFAWDSDFYMQIATSGYEYVNNQLGANIAFFPLYSLLIHGGMKLGLSPEMAGILINNLAFLGGLILLYNWVQQTQPLITARWIILVVAFCPLSLFGTVIYSEGLFLLFSIGALKAFDERKYLSLGIWGILATATRVTGLALIPAFLWVSWREKRPLKAYIASLSTSIGLGSYSLYCWFNFNDPLAFINVQHQVWERQKGFDWEGWLKMLMQITIGGRNWRERQIVDVWHPLIFILICLGIYGLWYFREQIGVTKFDYGSCFLLFILWLLAGDPLLNTVPVLGGGLILWLVRKEISLVAVIYGFLGIGLLLASGGTISLNRLAYGIIPLSMALGIILSKNRRWGYCAIAFFCLTLVLFSIRFAQHQWVA